MPTNTAEIDIEIDPRPGNYYVTALKDVQHFPLLGPFTSHPQALEKVPIIKLYAGQLDSRFLWLAFGTSRIDEGVTPLPQGTLNLHWPLEYVPGTQIVRQVNDAGQDVDCNVDQAAPSCK